MTLLLIIALILLLVVGAPIFSVMLGFALLGAMTTGRGVTDFAIDKMVSIGLGDQALILSTIPLFIFCGYLMAEAKTADRMVRFAKAFLGWLPGGLAVVTIFACAIFTTFSGASGVTIVALGGLIMPALLKEHYPEKFALGLVAGTGSVGLLFPPALPLIVYGTVYGLTAQSMAAAASHGNKLTLIHFSMDRFLFAGIVPGLVLVTILCAMAIAVAIYRKVPRQKFEFAELGRSLVIGIPEMGLPFLIILALAKGMQISEVAALTAVYVLLVELVLFRDVKLTELGKITRDSMVLVGAIFIIILAAGVLTNYFSIEQVPTKIMAWISGHIESKWAFLLALNVVLLVVGMLMDIFSAIVVVVPLIVPAAHRFGIDPYHLGVIFLLNLEIGYITPPVGLNLFIASFKFQKPIVDVVRSTWPFLAAMIVALGLVTYVPALTVVPPPARHGRPSELLHMVEDAYGQLGMVKKLTLPDGTVKKLADCDNASDQLSVLACKNLFKTVTKCRKAAGGKTGTPCETKAIAAFAAQNAAPAAQSDGGDDWGSDFDDDGGAADPAPLDAGSASAKPAGAGPAAGTGSAPPHPSP